MSSTVPMASPMGAAHNEQSTAPQVDPISVVWGPKNVRGHHLVDKRDTDDPASVAAAADGPSDALTRVVAAGGPTVFTRSELGRLPVLAGRLVAGLALLRASHRRIG
jgi:hypothetical protein